MNLPYLPVTSMLNGKYIILGGEYPPVVNGHAFGNCWFVDYAVNAANPDEEIALLAGTDLKTSAVIGKDFSWAAEKLPSYEDGVVAMPVENSDSIKLTYYAPNELRYTFDTSAERAAIFSEIYYPKGWKAWIEPAGAYGQVKNGCYQQTAEGQSIDLFRANWMLRGAIIPEGKGQLIMRFEPESYRIGTDISRATSITLILLLFLSIGVMAASNCSCCSRKTE